MYPMCTARRPGHWGPPRVVTAYVLRRLRNVEPLCLGDFAARAPSLRRALPSMSGISFAAAITGLN
eukprot:11208699-Lingulodinium_polyedra.AAC.1